ncbi:hypothetical protein C5167_019131 [Papaver somniferum]|uniref:Uncharacterized protein n=1 Tax=Papaver somniferum TaxID=3469 RepID=A0A4Y7IT87_PAPSO|nr:hypothetical protein C5167_019131 [Papaver somniferum]
MGWHVAGGKFKDEKFDATEHILSLGGDGNVNVAIANGILCEVSDSVDVKVNVESINAVTGSQEKEMPHSPKKRKIP